MNELVLRHWVAGEARGSMPSVGIGVILGRRSVRAAQGGSAMVETSMIKRITPGQFHNSAGVEDWRVLCDGASAYFRTDSLGTGARLVNAISELDDVTSRPDVDVRYDGVTARLNTITDDYYGLTGRDVELARRISAVAHALDVPADPLAVQSIQVSIDARAISEVMPF